MLSGLREIDGSVFSHGSCGARGVCSTCAMRHDREQTALYMAQDRGGHWHALCHDHAEKTANASGLTLDEVMCARSIVKSLRQ